MSYVLTVPEDLVERNPPVAPPLGEREAARRYGRLLQASAGAARALGGLEERFAGETDWASAPERFRAEADAIGRDFADSFGDDRTGRALFLRDFAALAGVRAAAFAQASEKREQKALQAAYAERMAGLSQIARGADGPQRDEALRQAALEAHGAHAFGLESDPSAAVERFVTGLQSLRSDGPGTESFGAPSQAPADRVAYERRASEGWVLPAPPKTQKPKRPGRSVAPPQLKDSFGFPGSELVQRDIDRYTEAQNTGEGDEARTPGVIGRDYWAAKKALDVDPNNLAAQGRLNQIDRELDLYPIKKLLGKFELRDHLDHYVKDRKEVDEIRGR